MRKLITRLATVAVLAGGGVAVAASPAMASYAQCPSDYMCLYNGANGLGTPTDIVYVSPGTCYTITIAAANNTADSIFNDLSNGHHVTAYDGSACNGQLLFTTSYGSSPIPALHHTNFVPGIGPSDYRNRASSIFFNNY